VVLVVFCLTKDEHELIAFADKLCSQMAIYPDNELSQWSQAPSVEYMPLTYRLPISGIQVNMRMLQGSDVGRYYDTFLEAASIDQGFR
jgi:hypothetical protein